MDTIDQKCTRPDRMRRILLAGTFLAFFLSFIPNTFAQSNQVLENGSPSTPVNFTGSGCIYKWVNSNPSIGLAAIGTGNIASFTATNNSSSPVTATITATPVPTGFAYIANWNSSNVSVISTANNSVAATIAVGLNPFGVCISHNNKYVYVANIVSNSVSVINIAQNTLSATIQVGTSPYSICTSPDDTRLYVVNNQDNSISVVNTATNTVSSTIQVSASPYAIAISPDGSRVYVAHNIMSNSKITVINTSNNQIVTTIPIAVAPDGITVSPNGSSVYASNVGSNSVTVINTSTNKVSKVIPVGSSPEGITISPDGSKVYTANYNSNNVSVISTVSNSVVSTIPVGSGPTGIFASPNGESVYVTNDNDNTVSVINMTSNAVTNTVNVGQYPDSQGIFVTNTLPTNCSPITLTITVKPTSTPAIITASPVTGTITACVGTASASPNIQQFTVSGSNLSAPVTANATTGFEVSLTAATGYTNSVMLNQSSGSLSSTTIYVRSAAGDAAGQISGDVVISSPGAATQNVAVSGNVNALPKVNPVANQNVTNGSSTTAVNFTGIGNTFNWTNDTPTIGLASSGTGNIGSFTAVNTGSSPVTATITVIPTVQNYAYITNGSDGTISVINLINNQVVTIIPITPNAGPWGVSISPDGKYLYTANSNNNTISIINTLTNTIVKTFNSTFPYALCVSPNNRYLYVTNYTQNSISIINTTTYALVSSIAVGRNPTGIAISPDGSRVYVVNSISATISVINTASNTVTTTIKSPDINPNEIAVSPDGKNLYFTAQQYVYTVNTATNTISGKITVGYAPFGIVVSPDNKLVYEANANSNNISVIDVTSQTVVATIPVGTQPEGVSLTPDGNTLMVTNYRSNSVSVINTTTNTVIATIPVGAYPISLGNFIEPNASYCPGSPTTFTITVNPSSTPTITAGTVTGNITGCEGTASSDVRQFIVSGSGLTANITATAPLNFEISLDAITGFSNSLTLTQINGTVSNAIVYVRSAATATAGNISGKVDLTSAGATSQAVVVSYTLNAIPSVDAVISQTLTNGAATSSVSFTGTANTFNWVNDTPGIGLAASGTGDIPSFTAVNNTAKPITAIITVIPLNNTSCNGTPIIFTITVNPTFVPTTLNAAANLTALATIYGTPSSAESFTVSGTNISGGISVTPPLGFEVSSNNTAFNTTTTINGNGNISSTSVYIRLAAITSVGSYSGNITLSAINTASVNIFMPASKVSPAPLTVTADNITKPFGAANPPLTVTYSGFVNNDGPAQLNSQPVVTTTALTQSPVGQYPITVSDATSPDYTLTYIPGILIIEPSLTALAIPNTFTPNGDGINDTWVIKYLNYYPESSVNIFDRWGQKVFSSIGYPIPWDGTYKGTALPSGTYYYIIDPKNGQAVFSGWLAIIR